MLSQEVKHYPDLLAALKQRGGDGTVEYAVWLFAQVIDHRRAGWVELPQLEAFVNEHGIQPLAKPGAVRKTLEKGFAFFTYLNGRADRPPRIYLKNVSWAVNELGCRDLVELRPCRMTPDEIVALFDAAN